MAFLDIVFPENVSYGATGGGGWSTRVVVTDSGREYRQSLWGRTRGRWTVGHNLRGATDWDTLISFHRITQGKTFGFRFKDWTDFQDLGRGIMAVNSAGNVQLAKFYQATDIVTSAVYTNVRLISKPRPGTITTYLSGTPTSTAIDYATGKCTALSSPTNWTWSGSFDVPARFDTDEPELSFDIPTAVGWRGVPIIEIRVEDP
jgi:uncharacterized protein (TIGR02217 family)